MEFLQVRFPGDKAYALPIGDIHLGDKAFGRQGQEKLRGNLEWLAEHEHEAFGVFMGDVFNVAGRDTKTSPFESDSREIKKGIEFFRPYARLFKGAITGNHERRISNAYGFDPLELFCDALGIPYLGAAAVIRVQVGKRPDSDSYWQSYFMAVHHTTGGGGKIGNSLSGVDKLSQVVPGCDVYCGGHNHQLSTAVRTVYTPTPHGVKPQKVTLVSCGSYLDYPNSYAEAGLYQPGKLGSPRIRFSGVRDHHDLHVSL